MLVPSAWRKVIFFIFNNLIMLYSRYLENRKHCLSIFCNFTMTRYTILITDEKLQKSLKRWYYSAPRWHSGDLMVRNITFLMIVAVFHPSPLTLDKLQFLVSITCKDGTSYGYKSWHLTELWSWVCGLTFLAHPVYSGPSYVDWCTLMYAQRQQK